MWVETRTDQTLNHSIQNNPIPFCGTGVQQDMSTTLAVAVKTGWFATSAKPNGVRVLRIDTAGL